MKKLSTIYVIGESVWMAYLHVLYVTKLRSHMFHLVTIYEIYEMKFCNKRQFLLNSVYLFIL